MSGKKLSEEHIAHLSESRRGKKRSEGAKENIKSALNNPIIRKKISDGLKRKRTEDPTFSGRQGTKKGAKFSESHRLKLVVHLQGLNKGRKATPETRKTLSEAQEKRWAKLTPDERMVLLEKFTEGGKRIRSSSLEQSMWEVLEKLGIVFEKQKHIGPFFVDIFVPMENLIIECDGEYWHNLPGRPEKDRKRDDYLKEKGFGVIHILEKDIRNNPRLALLDRVAF